MSGGVKGRKLFYTAPTAMTAEQLLKQNGYSKALVTELKKPEDGMMLEGKRIRSTTLLQAGQVLEVTLPYDDVKRAKSDISIPIIYQDEDIIVYDKPYGIACHRSGSHISDTIENTFEGVFRAVTRLDRDTSGLLLVARHQLAAAKLWQKTSKRYVALVEGHFERITGRIELPIMRFRPYDMRRIVDECGDPALTEYRVLDQNNGGALVECILRTGRTHQVRVHFAAIGHPLLGDDFYGGSTDLINRQALHCWKLEFIHPIIEQKMNFCAPLPADMAAAADKLGIKY
ncbi:MAG: RluA family pseudouridine synthase [Oscillospiraceae bacterium]|nr:RluA family pseudouridine synthase [Oscillospiraceae bacterium]